MEIVQRVAMHAFEVPPKRWIVERTCAGFSRRRRLSKDDETWIERREPMVRIAKINVMIPRLRPG